MARATVLVVERDVAIRELLRAALEVAGYGVIANAGDGVLRNTRLRPDLVLVDVSASNGGEPSLAAVMRIRASAIPVIAMTTLPANARLHSGLADAWLVKPFRLDDLYSAVERCIGLHARSA